MTAQALTLDQMMAAANQAAAVGEDMTEGTSGGGSTPMPVGTALARLIRVVELGEHSQKDFTTKKHKGYAKEVHLAFALWGTGRTLEGEQVTFHNPETNAPRIWSPFDMALSRNTGSTAFRLFKQLNWKNDKVNFAQLLNGTFLMPFTSQNKSKTDTTQISKLNIDGITGPFSPLDQSMLAIPEVATEEMRLFLWDFPSKAAWDSLFVEGEWPAKGDKPAASKNKIQLKIMSANNYKGSPLEILLAGGGAALPDFTQLAVPAAAPVQAAPVAAVPVQAVPVAAVPAAAVPVAAVPVQVAAPLEQTAPVAAAPVPQAAPVGVPQAAIPVAAVPVAPSNVALPY